MFFVLMIATLLIWGPRSYEPLKTDSKEIRHIILNKGGEAVAAFRVFPKNNDHASITVLDQKSGLSKEATGGPITGIIYIKGGRLYLEVIPDKMGINDNITIPLN